MSTTLARTFIDRHVPGQPLILYNIWDAGTARAATQAGAQAIATGSHSVAEAQGYADGQDIPLTFLLDISRRIVASTPLPVSIDFEGGFATDNPTLATNIQQVIDTGAVGINFEDQVVGGDGLYTTSVQADRIATVRDTAAGTDWFINARTDVFLQSDASNHAGLVDVAIARGLAYAAAGANGFFIPGIQDTALIRTICQAVPIPVNVMWKQGSPPVAVLANAGVARVSHGPGPYVAAMQAFEQAAVAAMTT
ncbi:MAG: isocitrate lyase/phosphoenolpyruvate mutase family protein [Pseudomonadota bacterium]